MERLLAIWIKELSVEAPDGSTLRTTLSLIDALQIICPFTEVIRLGLFVLPIRGPSRFYGGDEGVLNAVSQCVKEVSGFTPSLGVGEGLFCAEVLQNSKYSYLQERVTSLETLCHLST